MNRQIERFCPETLDCISEGIPAQIDDKADTRR